MDAYAAAIVATLLVSLRLAPTFAFAPPFSLLRVPLLVRLSLSLWLAYWLVLANPAQTQDRLQSQHLLTLVCAELLLGMTLAIALQLAFAALLTVGRAIDIQAGFGLAQVADPTLRQQLPLVGSLFSYAAGAVFFSTGGPADLLAIWSHSIETIPMGQLVQTDVAVLGAYASAVLATAVGIAGLVLLVLFVIDAAVAFMSRTLPQMNMLVFGFQVKSLALLMTLPFAFVLSGALFLRLVRTALDAMPRLI